VAFTPIEVLGDLPSLGSFVAMLERACIASFRPRNYFALSVSLCLLNATAQQPDSLRIVELPSAVVLGDHRGMRPLPDTLGTVLMAGKKAVTLDPRNLAADLSVNQARQVFAKIPGMHVWENDGSGAQLGIATRGLSPNRSWEFNLRQDGADIAADAFGYPEAYYTPPMEAVERINVVRGAAGLAYGPQFGGMVDFVMRRGATDRVIAGSFRQTVGSYGLFNTYTDLGGTKGKWNYFGFVQHRRADGWRANSAYSTTAAHVGLRYAVSQRLKVGLSYTHNSLEQQQPGGLTDDNYVTDPRRSLRARNWLVAPWNVASLTAEWRPDSRTLIDAKVFGVIADRSSVGFVKAISVPDTISRNTGAYAARQVDRDGYRNLGVEVRMRRSWNWGGRQQEWSVGVRGYAAENARRQQGAGTTGTNADLAVTGDFGKELDLSTRNAALYMENLFRVGERTSIVPGARVERIVSRVEGRINTTDAGAVDSGERERTVVLFGLGVQQQATAHTVLYANISQAYRPVLYGDLTPSATTDQIDPNLRDSRGYNADIGYRGRLGNVITFDAGLFLLQYNNRIGSRAVEGIVQRTNIGASQSRGAEVYVEADLLRPIKAANAPRLSLFASYAYVDARYTRWNDPAIAEDPNKRIANNRVENAPQHVLRSGLEAGKGRCSVSVQTSLVTGVFTDASNTQLANANATIGWLPGYTLMDATAGVQLSEAVKLTVGVNNALDARYATRRAGGYPGPGLLPGMGRQFFATLAAQF